MAKRGISRGSTAGGVPSDDSAFPLAGSGSLGKVVRIGDMGSSSRRNSRTNWSKMTCSPS